MNILKKLCICTSLYLPLLLIAASLKGSVSLYGRLGASPERTWASTASRAGGATGCRSSLRAARPSSSSTFWRRPRARMTEGGARRRAITQEPQRRCSIARWDAPRSFAAPRDLHVVGSILLETMEGVAVRCQSVYRAPRQPGETEL